MSRWRRRTYGVDSAVAPTDVAGVQSVFTAVLTALRGDADRVVADLFARDTALPPAARTAAFELHQRTRPDVLGTYDRNPFQSVVINHADETQWRALLEVAPYSKDLRFEAGLFADLLSSSGGLGTLRLRLRDEQADRVRQQLRAIPGHGPVTDLRPRPGWGRRAV